ncbi:phosphatase PAP2 family protein [Lysinibacillus halotolerans]|uniref:phosphatase PAP2 family protein n=1 Tax=Lysinibacillus halotolerans TaxID=1368476 RepID=UPI001F4DDC5B|nr:phosphatase PAP2 family protein [Lysinibacillus halotolerans]
MLKPWNYILAGVTFFIFLALLLSFDSECIQQLDNTLAELFGGNVFITAFHYIGDTWFVISIGLLLLIVLWLKERNYHGMIFVLLTIAAGNVLNQLVKKWIERPRPEIVDQLSTFSFPSGHAMLSLLYLFTIAYLVGEWVGNSKKSRIVWVIAIILSFLIGLSRIAESRHFGSDVIAGWSLGYTWFVLCVFWYEQSKRKFNKLKNNT